MCFFISVSRTDFRLKKKYFLKTTNVTKIFDGTNATKAGLLHWYQANTGMLPKSKSLLLPRYVILGGERKVQSDSKLAFIIETILPLMSEGQVGLFRQSSNR